MTVAAAIGSFDSSFIVPLEAMCSKRTMIEEFNLSL
jgi:hypothetical protein